jgi:hypothetical protein
MDKNTGKGSRKGAVKERTQTKNTRTKQWVERDELTPSAKPLRV